MLSSLMGGASLADIIIQILYRIPAVIIAITLHEYAHARMACWLGDNTAKYMGRLTVNPKAHFDWMGALCMLLFGFGWANPVPFSYRNLKKPKRDSALIALAGPLMNLIIATVSMVLLASVLALGVNVVQTQQAGKLFSIILGIIYAVFALNIGLMIFNLLPIPPLDGSKILFSLLPAKAYRFILNYERYGSLILMVLIVVGALDIPLGILIGVISEPFYMLGESVSAIFGVEPIVFRYILGV